MQKELQSKEPPHQDTRREVDVGAHVTWGTVSVILHVPCKMKKVGKEGGYYCYDLINLIASKVLSLPKAISLAFYPIILIKEIDFSQIIFTILIFSIILS